MNRFQKKCLIASAAMHGLLFLVLIVGTAFNSEKKIETTRIITLVNAVVTDGPTRGDGAPPAPAPAVKPQEIVQPKPAPEPPKQIEQPKPKPPEPKKVEAEIPVQKIEKPIAKPTPVVKPVTTQPKRNIPDINKPTTRTPDRKVSNDAAERAAQKKAEAERLANLKSSLQNIGKSLSPSTTIEMPGGIGGAAEINYRDLVLSRYDEAWVAPDDVDDNEANAKVRVVIARSGNVVSSEIINASRNAKLDASVRRTLNAVRFIAPFPESSKDSQRTFIINFNLKSRRGIG